MTTILKSQHRLKVQFYFAYLAKFFRFCFYLVTSDRICIHVRLILAFKQLHFCIGGIEHARPVLPGGTIKDLHRLNILTWYLPLKRRKIVSFLCLIFTNNGPHACFSHVYVYIEPIRWSDLIKLATTKYVPKGTGHDLWLCWGMKRN